MEFENFSSVKAQLSLVRSPSEVAEKLFAAIRRVPRTGRENGEPNQGRLPSFDALVDVGRWVGPSSVRNGNGG